MIVIRNRSQIYLGTFGDAVYFLSTYLYCTSLMSVLATVEYLKEVTVLNTVQLL